MAALAGATLEHETARLADSGEMRGVDITFPGPPTRARPRARAKPGAQGTRGDLRADRLTVEEPEIESEMVTTSKLSNLPKGHASRELCQETVVSTPSRRGRAGTHTWRRLQIRGNAAHRQAADRNHRRGRVYAETNLDETHFLLELKWRNRSRRKTQCRRPKARCSHGPALFGLRAQRADRPHHLAHRTELRVRTIVRFAAWEGIAAAAAAGLAGDRRMRMVMVNRASDGANGVGDRPSDIGYAWGSAPRAWRCLQYVASKDLRLLRKRFEFQQAVQMRITRVAR